MQATDRYDLTVYSGCVRVTMDAAAPPVPGALPADATGVGDPSTWRADQGVSLVLDGYRAPARRSPSGLIRLPTTTAGRSHPLVRRDPTTQAIRPTSVLLKEPKIRSPMCRVGPILYSKSPILRPASW